MNQFFTCTTNDEKGRISFSPEGRDLIDKEFGHNSLTIVDSLASAVSCCNEFNNFKEGGKLASDQFINISFNAVDGVIRIVDPRQQLKPSEIRNGIINDGIDISEACILSKEKPGVVTVKLKTYPMRIRSDYE